MLSSPLPPPPELRSSLGASRDPMVANPFLERRRYLAVKALRSLLARLTTQHSGKGVKAPQLCFEPKRAANTC